MFFKDYFYIVYSYMCVWEYACRANRIQPLSKWIKNLSIVWNQDKKKKMVNWLIGDQYNNKMEAIIHLGD